MHLDSLINIMRGKFRVSYNILSQHFLLLSSSCFNKTLILNFQLRLLNSGIKKYSSVCDIANFMEENIPIRPNRLLSGLYGMWSSMKINLIFPWTSGRKAKV